MHTQNDDVYAMMLGPKAENHALYRELFLEAFEDHCFWRRNYQPFDPQVISAEIQSSPDFRRLIERLRNNLYRFLSHAKQGVPFTSARYVGHMNTDLLAPAILGYFGAIFYNNNNVAGVSSPATVKLEQEVIRMMCDMIGYPAESDGHLTSGGTSANLTALWLARNFRSQPIALRLLIATGAAATWRRLGDVMKKDRHLSKLLDGKGERAFNEKCWKGIQEIELADGSRLDAAPLWKLANTPICEIPRLLTPLNHSIRLWLSDALSDPAAAYQHSSRLAYVLMDDFDLKRKGAFRFRQAVQRIFPDDKWFWDEDWIVLGPENKHYSWPKGCDLLGLGETSFRAVSLRKGFEMDPQHLATKLREFSDTKTRRWVLFMSSTFGTTEEGAVDDLVAIDSVLKQELKAHGLVLWHHVDACYGGYLASLLGPIPYEGGYGAIYRSSGRITESEIFERWIENLGTDGARRFATGIAGEAERQKVVEAEEALIRQLVTTSETGTFAWLSWEQLQKRTDALSCADSVSIDPHKLGYIPYPAGALLLRHSAAKDSISAAAPYLFNSDNLEDSFSGRYTLEGSKPGAAAAACWLAHKTIPLAPTGHGKLLALSILGARRLYVELHSHFSKLGKNSGARVAFVYQPHTNILCYAPYHLSFLRTEEINRLTTKVLERLSPTGPQREFMAVSTTLDLGHMNLEQVDDTGRLAEVKGPFVEFLAAEQKANFDSKSLQVIRSVVMSPLALHARASRHGVDARKQIEELPAFRVYAEFLQTTIESAAEELREQLALEAASRWKRDLVWFIMDDDEGESVHRQLRVQIPVLDHPRLRWFVDSNGEEGHGPILSRQADAMQRVQNSELLDLVFLDVNMTRTGGSEDGGLKVFRAILERNRAKGNGLLPVQIVVFFTAKSSIRPALERMDADYPGWRTSVKVFHLPKSDREFASGAVDQVRGDINDAIRHLQGLTD